jgi:hypothetical protein
LAYKTAFPVHAAEGGVRSKNIAIRAVHGRVHFFADRLLKFRISLILII